ncbi:ABC transporter ATP-binding protein [Bifidobacterium sp.]|jgi:peptide/nickel transport system ATP-binding protein|uniref:ABC transporter ATP-binding protein n=1 Tax=Bifidobacterium sp. TaxID=41200 RepID=UPI0025BF644C|nr:ABC transporter ATP-binding protein [Bifidobacterium sp.]MCH4209897.1 ABC transporter ATP-binding protein [Bifidobacterium sp.]MCI1225353.1 ABC transporter ATP-binding protein [Bifidobacterium sp.]
MSLLNVNNLSIEYDTPGIEPVKAVNDVSFSLEQGEFVGLVGESGSGKSTLGFALTRLSKPPARISHGTVLFDGKDIRALSDEELRRQRQGGFAMVLQSGMNALNPVRTIRKHFTDIFKAHKHVPKSRFEARSRELIAKVGLPERTLDRYPGELSGGMRQRVSVALALSLDPKLMVFDEPTTALDVLVQHEVMDTIRELQAQEGFTAMLISHDLGIVLESTSRVLVMHNGSIVEDAPSERILHAPQDDYTKMLLSHYGDPRAEEVSVPGLERKGIRKASDAGRPQDEKLTVTLTGVNKVYPAHKRGDEPVHAVNDVSFTLRPGESLALVGASGSGKSTIAKMLTGVEQPTSGTITLGNKRIDRMRGRKALRELHSDIQMVFQDPYAALNPLHTVEYILMRPILNYTDLRGSAARRHMLEILETVGLTPVEQYAAKLPHQLSGGQRQRVVIARALASNPKVLVADEPVSMLDMTLRAGVLALLDDLRVRLSVSMLYITHDLLSARLITDNIMVLNHGTVVERGETASVLRHPHDEYTIRLLDSIPKLQTSA